MHFTVDMQLLRVVHAHTDRRVCVALADIELPHAPVRHLEVQVPGDLDSFTDYELQVLYKNSTGQAAPGYFRDHVLRGLSAAMLSIPQADAVLEEVVAQSAAIDRNDTRRFRYVRGSRKPLPVDELFELPYPLASQTDAGVLQQQGARLVAEPVQQPAPPDSPLPPSAASRVRAPSAPGEGSVTQRIFSLCDELRAHMPEASLEAVRKVAIPKLEAMGVNSNSARKGSAMWVQSRR